MLLVWIWIYVDASYMLSLSNSLYLSLFLHISYSSCLSLKKKKLKFCSIYLAYIILQLENFTFRACSRHYILCGHDLISTGTILRFFLYFWFVCPLFGVSKKENNSKEILCVCVCKAMELYVCVRHKRISTLGLSHFPYTWFYAHFITQW